MLAVGTSTGDMLIYDVRQSKKPLHKYQNRKRKVHNLPKVTSINQIHFGLCDASLWALHMSPAKSYLVETSKRGATINMIKMNTIGTKFQLLKVCFYFGGRKHFVHLSDNSEGMIS